MKITVLGNNGPYPGKGKATSGYLIEVNNKKFVIDFGSGTYSRLLNYIDSLDELEFIIISHLHFDHISDLSILKYATVFKAMNNQMKNKLKIYMPSTPEKVVEEFKFDEGYQTVHYDENTQIGIENVILSFSKMNHPVETYSIKINYNNETLLYTSDTAWFDGIEDLVNDVDYLLVECGYSNDDHPERRVHLSPKEIKRLTENSKIKKVLYTHFFPEHSMKQMVEEISENHNKQVIVTEELKQYIL